MINLKMYNGKWRMEITNETWEFPTTQELKETLKSLIAQKDSYGHISRDEK
jgi:hypothetical protein